MDIQTRKIKFIQKFLRIEDESLILRMEELLKIAQAESERDLKPFTVEELNQRIEQSEEDFKSGRYKTTQELLKKFNL
ncbi:MAG: hypothetical protein WCY16_11510 [Weeksellaceae bacterium]